MSITRRQTIELSANLRRRRLSPSFSDLRSQIAFIRALLDELERAAPADAHPQLLAQTVEELARLGCRCLETASVLTEVPLGPVKAVGGGRQH